MKRMFLHIHAGVLFVCLVACARAGESARPTPTSQPSPTVRPEPAVRKVDPSGAIFNVAEFLDENSGYAFGNMAGFRAGAVMRTADGGSTWTYNELILPECTQFCDVHGIDVVDADLIWAGTDVSFVYYSTDAGKNWNRVADPGPAAITFPYVSFLDAQQGWIGYPLEIFSTSDGGHTWSALPLPDGVDQVAAIDRPGADGGYLLDSSGRLHKTTDDGRTWTTQDLGLGKAVLVNGELPNAAMRFPDPQHGVIVLGLVDDGGTVRMLRTSDGGKTWAQTSLPIRLGSLHLSNDGSVLSRVQSLDLMTVLLRGV
jgi:photosystem II stability/assembly factor-like uncharacterized protein